MLKLVFWLMVSVSVYGQEIISFNDLQKRTHQNNDTIYVINFWATWCSPCIEELPYFEVLRDNYRSDKLRVILVSLDFKSQLQKKVIPFLQKNNIRSTVWLLDEPDANAYIDKVSKEWSGAIPATLILNGKKNIKQFYEKQFTENELQSIIKPLMKGD